MAKPKKSKSGSLLGHGFAAALKRSVDASIKRRHLEIGTRPTWWKERPHPSAP